MNEGIAEERIKVFLYYYHELSKEFGLNEAREIALRLTEIHFPGSLTFKQIPY
jgi:hypothetical protein